MNINKLSWRNITSNPLNTFLSLLLMTFGVGIISLLLLLNNQIKDQLNNNLRGIDMVVGAKGSPLQLILSSVYHVDNPTGNIPYLETLKLEKNSLVDLTVPLSYGDSYNGFRIVGTTKQYLNLYDADLLEGKVWKNTMEVVLGNTVAKVNDLKLGDKFYGTHGLSDGGHIHDNFSYVVVGILKQSNSIIDNLVLTNLESVWQVHDPQEHDCSSHDHHHHDHYHPYEITDQTMITAMLVKFKSPVGLIQLPRKINETTNLQAAVPTFEINRLTNLFGFGVQTINSIALIIIIVSGFSIFISLYNSLKRRRYELALIRVHGASRWQLVRLVILEGFILSVLGTIFGLLISRLALYIIPIFIKSTSIGNISVGLINEELILIPISIIIGLLASLIPTIMAYNINIPKTLSDA